MAYEPLSSLQLTQQFQQQRIMELQMAQQRAMEMSFMNQNRFTNMRDQFLAATMPFGGMPHAGEMSVFGRQLAQVGGITRQSLAGTIIDANSELLRTNLFFRRAGFQFGQDRGLIQERAKGQLNVFTRQLGNVVRDTLTPGFVQSALGTVGLGNIQEDSLGILDAFAGIRGRGSNTFNRIGIKQETAADAYEGFVKSLNYKYDGRLSAEAIKSLGAASLASADGADLATAAAGGAKGIEKLLTKQTEQLEKIARNTGVSVDKIGELVTQNMALGNGRTSLAAASNLVNTLGPSSSVSRFTQIQTALQLTAQGRQLNVEDADAFSASQMSRIGEMVSKFTNKQISRAELFRFGGENEWDAATRVQNQRLNQGVGYAQRNTATQGVLGNRALASQSAGLLSNTRDIAAAYARNPYAGVVARFDRSIQQELLDGSPEGAFLSAVNNVKMYPGVSDLSRDALIKAEYARIMEISDMEAGRQVDDIQSSMRMLDEQINASPEEYAGLSSEDVRSRVYSAMPTLRKYGLSPVDAMRYSDIRKSIFEGNVNIGRVKAATSRVDQSTIDKALDKLDKYEMKYDRDYAYKDSRWAFHKISGGLFRGYESIGKEGLGVSMHHLAHSLTVTKQAEYGLTPRRLAEEIFEQAGSDGDQEFSSIEAVEKKLGNRRDVFASFNTGQREYMRKFLADVIVNKTIMNNAQAVNDGRTADTPLFVRMVPSN